MNASNIRSRKTPINHAEPLAALHLIYAVFHGFALSLILLLSGGALLSGGGRAWGNEIVRDGIMGSLIASLFLIALPLFAAYSLSKKRAWAKALVAISAAVALLFSALVAYIGLVDRSESGVVIYVAPCLAIGVYSFWFVCWKAAV